MVNGRSLKFKLNLLKKQEFYVSNYLKWQSTNHHLQVCELLESQDLTTGRFAVEIDGMLVPKTRLADTSVADGMIIEVVQAVGGG